MKVLSLLQPWATLLVSGHKLIETRSWPTHYRGPVFIHASGALNKKYKDSEMTPALQSMEPFFKDHIKLPKLVFGKIIGMVNIATVIRTEDIKPFLSDKEIAFGDYSAGRWAYQCYDNVAFHKHTDLKGQLGIRDCPVATLCHLCDRGNIPSSLYGHTLGDGEWVSCQNFPDFTKADKQIVPNYQELIHKQKTLF